jgi:hypothetical protein
MRRLNLESYPVEIRDVAGEVTQTTPYDVKRSTVAVLLNGQLNMGPDTLLKHFELAQKVRAADGDLLLEEADYGVLLAALNGLRGFTENDVELVMRIRNAPQVDVQAKEKVIDIVPKGG